MNIQILSILFLLFVIIIIINFLRKRSITIKYAIVWLIPLFILLIASIVPGFLDYITKLFGFTLGSNLVFALLIGLLMLVTIALTVIVSSQNVKIKTLIQEVSLLKSVGKKDE